MKTSMPMSRGFQAQLIFTLWIIFSTALANQQILETTTDLKTIRNELKNAEIIPTVIDDFIPSIVVNVSWPNAAAQLGNTIPPSDAQSEPTIKLGLATSLVSKMTYTIAMTDPDAPSRENPEWSEFCHWIATSVPSTKGSSKGLSRLFMKKKDVIPYKPPGPPAKTGKHRYAFLIFVPANGTKEELYLSTPSDRKHWGTGKVRNGARQWASQNGLVPIGANFIYAQNAEQ